MSHTSSSIRSRIMEAAFSAFMQFGYEGASTSEIARLARVSKRDLYAHFPNKQAMLEACVTERAERMRRPLELPVPRTQSALRQTLTDYGTTVLRELSEPEVLATFRLAILNAEAAPAVAQTLDRFGRSETTRALEALLSDVRGLLNDADPQTMARIFFCILMGDLLLRLIMRVAEAPSETEALGRAELATNCLLRLYGAA
ncbi:MAG TPA: TetR/AcrR family transcriptional regulator [Rhodopila sp.]|jgi:AcrR family transcriptional regulator